MKTSIPKLHSYKLKNMDNVHVLPTPDNKDVSPFFVISNALEKNLKDLCVVGRYENGELYWHSTFHENEKTAFLFLKIANYIADTTT
jgi:hypothetical protein